VAGRRVVNNDAASEIGKQMTDIENKLRKVAYCNMAPEYEGDSSRADFSLALKAARLIKRQRKEIQALLDELAYHGRYPK
jgi:hypothetical protein